MRQFTIAESGTEWSGCSCPASDRSHSKAKDSGARHVSNTKIKDAVVGIDIGKNSFHVVGLDQRGAMVLRQKWSRVPSGSAVCQYAAAAHRVRE